MKRSIGIAVAMVALASVAFCANNTVGTWKWDPAKSKTSPGQSPIKSLTVVREMSAEEVKTSGKGEREDGSNIDFSYTSKSDGKESMVLGSGLPYDTIIARQVNANTVTGNTWKKGGTYKATNRFTVSEDGKFATLATKGKGANGKPFTSLSVYDKQKTE